MNLLEAKFVLTYQSHNNIMRTSTFETCDLLPVEGGSIEFNHQWASPMGGHMPLYCDHWLGPRF